MGLSHTPQYALEHLATRTRTHTHRGSAEPMPLLRYLSVEQLGKTEAYGGEKGW